MAKLFLEHAPLNTLLSLSLSHEPMQLDGI